jgi:hypothetical protein
VRAQISLSVIASTSAGTGESISVFSIASVTQQRDTDEAMTYNTRKVAEGKTKREARRAHKRHLANRVIRRLWNDERARRPHNTINSSP